MIARQALPESFDELRSVTIKVPNARKQSESSCPVSLADRRQYLAAEMFRDARDLPKLKYVRTGVIKQPKPWPIGHRCKLWYWAFREDDVDSYLLVARYYVLGLGLRHYTLADETFGLTPDQTMLAFHFGYL